MPRQPFDPIPAVVGTVAGLGSGVIEEYVGGPEWFRGAYYLALIAGGVAGHLMDWNDDVTYGLLTSGAWAVASQVPWAVYGKNPKLLYDVAPAQEVARHQGGSGAPPAPPPRVLPHTAARSGRREALGVL